MKPEGPKALLAKRIVLGVLGALGLVPLGSGVLGLLVAPSREDFFMLAPFLIGVAVSLTVLPRWDGWSRTRPGNRTGAIFWTTYLLPSGLLVFRGYQYPIGLMVIGLPLGFGTVALWWSLVGYRLDHPARPVVRR